jgi:hypothetical protein
VSDANTARNASYSAPFQISLIVWSPILPTYRRHGISLRPEDRSV